MLSILMTVSFIVLIALRMPVSRSWNELFRDFQRTLVLSMKLRLIWDLPPDHPRASIRTLARLAERPQKSL